MEEVLEKLETTIITQGSNEEENASFTNLYKNWGRLGNQEERRKELLEIQKTNRNQKLDRFRGILELVKAVEDNRIFRSHHKVFYRPNIYVAGFNKTSPTYSNVLMLSEWLVEKPEDFSENWYVVPCPMGVRMLVVASRGTTVFYTKYGHFKFECRTALPGGNPTNFNHHKCCILDCFYQEKNKTMYILDLLAWNDQPMTDGETEFRHFWLQSQLAEMPDLKVINKKNKIIFSLLPKVPCDTESLNTFMMTYPAFECNFPPLDGLLFFHKKAHYVSGETPLVGWLYPYMVPEVLGSEITVNERYLDAKPSGYINQVTFIQKFEEKMAKKKRPRHKSSSSMDTSGSETQESPDVTKSPSQDNTPETMESGESLEQKTEKMESGEHIIEADDRTMDEDRIEKPEDHIEKPEDRTMEHEDKTVETDQKEMGSEDQIVQPMVEKQCTDEKIEE